MRTRAIPIVVGVLVLLGGHADRAIAATRDRTEYFLHVHDELAYETGSAQWHELPAEEQAKDLEEGSAGRSAEVHDVLVLQPRSGGKLAFCIAHGSRLMSECSVSGVALKTATGEYVYRDIKPDDADEAWHECVLTIHRTSKKITLSDSVGENDFPSCKQNYCGFHGMLEDPEFAASERVTDPQTIAEALNTVSACDLPE